MKLFSIAPLAIALTAIAQASYINYTTVTGYFLQDEASTDASTFDYTTTNFGLINRTYPSDNTHNHNDNQLTQWERFHHHITTLNHHSPPTISYKVLFLGRHGEGYHNAAESYYGTPAWNKATPQQPGPTPTSPQPESNKRKSPTPSGHTR
ncbi:hypothetical protein AtubIFM57258_001348 [Aspergillus tubingensis]|nr:hypothetical protein AtubIFM57258_001348 [Aspergillus tubingensis]